MPFQPAKSIVNTWPLRVKETKVYFEGMGRIHVGLVVHYYHGSFVDKKPLGDILILQFGDGSKLKVLRSQCRPTTEWDIDPYRPNLPGVEGTG